MHWVPAGPLTLLDFLMEANINLVTRIKIGDRIIIILRTAIFEGLSVAMSMLKDFL